MKDGKVFGKINIIDLLVLILAVVIVAAVALKMTGRLGAVVPEVGTNITYTVRVERVDAEVYENVKSFIDQAKAAGKTGDQLMSNGACLSAYVTDVTALPAQEKTEITDTSVIQALVEMVRLSMQEMDIDHADELISQLRTYQYEKDLGENIQLLAEAVTNLDTEETGRLADLILQSLQG